MVELAVKTGSLRAANIFRQVMPLLVKHGLGMTLLAVALVSVPQAAIALLVPAEAEPTIVGLVLQYAIAIGLAAISSYLVAWWARLVWRDDQPAGQPAARLTPEVALFIAATAMLVQTGVYLGILALVVPGLLFGLATWVALPTAAIEGVSPLAAISRSAALTRGRRAGIFGIAVLTVTPTLAISLIGQEVITGWQPLQASNQNPIVQLIWRPLIFAPISMFLGLTVAVVYRTLRRDASPA